MIDEDVQSFANDNVDRNWARVEEPYVANGGNVPASAYGYVDPDAAASTTPASGSTETPVATSTNSTSLI